MDVLQVRTGENPTAYLYSEKKKKLKDFLNEKSVKITKQVHAFKGFAGII